MKRYIDAEKLKSVIKAQINERKNWMKDVDKSDRQDQLWSDLNGEDMSIIQIINSLQQEQERPKVDLVAELKHHLDTTPKEQLEKEWKELEPWGNIGPTVQEFLYGKQSEVDFDDEFAKFNIGTYNPFNSRAEIYDFARHFYELGLNAKNSQK